MSEIMMTDKAVMKDLSEIKPYNKNPRKNSKTIDLLCKMIPQVGFNVPLVIDKNGVIVKGHARYEAAKRLGMKQVPCVITYADPDAIRADRIADNKVQEFSKWNEEGLMHEVDMLDLKYDLTDMWLPRASFDDLPTFEDFEYEESYPEEEQESPDAKRERYLKFLEEQAKTELPKVQMATESGIKSAMIKQASMPSRKKEYVRCVCKRCGHIFYIDKNVYYDKNGTVRR